MKDWALYKSNTVVENHKEFVNLCHTVHRKFKDFNKDLDSTSSYNSYNFFTASDFHPLSYNLLKDIKVSIKDYIGEDKPIFIRAWLSFHMPSEVLDWHQHEIECHGYVSIEPKFTETLFKDKMSTEEDCDYKVINEIGKIYIGPGRRWHSVFVKKSYLQPRITIAFDIVHEFDRSLTGSWSFIPVL